MKRTIESIGAAALIFWVACNSSTDGEKQPIALGSSSNASFVASYSTEGAPVYDNELAALQRIKAKLDDMSWHCEESRGAAARTAAARLRGMLGMFRRVCERAREASLEHTESKLAAQETRQRQALISGLVEDLRSTVSHCGRLLPGMSTRGDLDSCDVVAQELRR